jgi:hypothetical protein
MVSAPEIPYFPVVYQNGPVIASMLAGGLHQEKRSEHEKAYACQK